MWTINYENEEPEDVVADYDLKNTLTSLGLYQFCLLRET